MAERTESLLGSLLLVRLKVLENHCVRLFARANYSRVRLVVLILPRTVNCLRRPVRVHSAQRVGFIH